MTKQREYVIWRDGVVKPGPKNFSTEVEKLPESDPSWRIAHRWRKALKDEAGDG